MLSQRQSLSLPLVTSEEGEADSRITLVTLRYHGYTEWFRSLGVAIDARKGRPSSLLITQAFSTDDVVIIVAFDIRNGALPLGTGPFSSTPKPKDVPVQVPNLLCNASRR